MIKDYKTLENENSILIKSNEQLQARLDQYDIASSSASSTCKHANLIEELATVVKYGLNPYALDINCQKQLFLRKMLG